MAKAPKTNVSKMIAKEKVIEKKTGIKPKTAVEKNLELKITKATGKPYKGKK